MVFQIYILAGHLYDMIVSVCVLAWPNMLLTLGCYTVNILNDLLFFIVTIFRTVLSTQACEYEAILFVEIRHGKDSLPSHQGVNLDA